MESKKLPLMRIVIIFCLGQCASFRYSLLVLSIREIKRHLPLRKYRGKFIFSDNLKLIVDYVTGAESKQLTRAEFEERGEGEQLKLPELTALLSKPVTN